MSSSMVRCMNRNFGTTVGSQSFSAMRMVEVHRITALRCHRELSTVRSTASSGSQVYESKRAVSEYLLSHFAQADDIMPYKFGPHDGTRFPERLAHLCMKHRNGMNKIRAMDVGCAVGAVSFHLTRGFDEVVGIDFSQHFIDAANEMKHKKTMKYSVLKQGDIFEDRVAHLPSGVVPTKATFLQGDACNMDKTLGKFDLIIAANLLCRLPSPMQFLQSVPSFLQPGGTFILISPYSWLEEYTPKSEWIGAQARQQQGGPSGSMITSYDVLSACMKDQGMKEIHREDVPFVIREHERKFQYGVSDCLVYTKATTSN